jgi:hypothetical protein
MKLKTVIAAIAGAVLYFFLGWLVYGILLMGFYEAHTVHYEGLMKEMPNLFAIFLSNLLMAFLFAWIFDKWANIRTFGKGFVGGMIISFLAFASMDISFAGMMNLYETPTLIVDIVVSTVLGGLIAGFIAWILGMELKKAEKPAT